MKRLINSIKITFVSKSSSLSGTPVTSRGSFSNKSNLVTAFS